MGGGKQAPSSATALLCLLPVALVFMYIASRRRVADVPAASSAQPLVGETTAAVAAAAAAAATKAAAATVPAFTVEHLVVAGFLALCS